jgi:hypothetical protein
MQCGKGESTVSISENSFDRITRGKEVYVNPATEKHWAETSHMAEHDQPPEQGLQTSQRFFRLTQEQ